MMITSTQTTPSDKICYYNIDTTSINNTLSKISYTDYVVNTTPTKNTLIYTLKLLTNQLEEAVSNIKKNSWENDEEIVELMNKINKLSLEC